MKNIKYFFHFKYKHLSCVFTIKASAWMSQVLAGAKNTTGSVHACVCVCARACVCARTHSAPYLGAPGHGGSSHLLQAGGPGCQERPVPAAQSQRPSQEGGPAAAGLTGVGAAGPGGRGQRERGAEPEAAAAVNRRRETRQRTSGSAGK